MKRLLLLLLISPSAAFAQAVTPNFTTGSMTQTVTATQTVNETIAIERFGGAVSTWNGDNVEAIDANGVSINLATTADPTDLEFHIVDATQPWQLEIITRPAGLIETVDTTRTIQTDTVTNTLSVFSQ
tara:strand:+ start:857 stop:1240 length:384 start_codon:yes stop_codon:yes gene_type:complete